MPAQSPSFERFGSIEPDSPVVISVPHAGRDYPAPIGEVARIPLDRLQIFEDRYADTLAQEARVTETMFVQRRARAWIDLNRGESDRDPMVDDGASTERMPTVSAKLRSGLGLIPRRVPGHGDAWRRRFSDAEVEARILTDYRPYHQELATALAAAHHKFGVAVLLDVHSMPSILPAGEGAQIVLGDRFGRSAAARFVHRVDVVAEAAELTVALNTPYSGGHILDRHASPARNIHAIQIEFDRALYLDPAGEAPGAGLAPTAKLLRTMIDALADEALATPFPIAAE